MRIRTFPVGLVLFTPAELEALPAAGKAPQSA
jgi:hypothetical protein